MRKELHWRITLRVVATEKIKEAQQRYPAAHMHLDGWYQIVSQTSFLTEHALRATFGDIRGFNFQYKFPIPETTLLVHTLINFESQVAYIEQIRPGNH
ncbi:hypothetical protein [Aliikangiella sp. G2MR2-5]|uniref:hypothetical protein n=1 Tax=Aliikangiella sp. G2MR2-5 TaxID=2788943 RepID=UPI001AED7899|nr:hypothetical protein [Aliikangiella sp. G2MR2-5]